MILAAALLLRVTILLEQQLEREEAAAVSEALAAVAGILTLGGVVWLYTYLLEWAVPAAAAAG